VPQFKVQMRTGNPSRASNRSDDLPGGDPLSRLDFELFAMTVVAGESIRMPDYNKVAVATVRVSKYDGATLNGSDHRA
jgi:hypothetical protein